MISLILVAAIPASAGAVRPLTIRELLQLLETKRAASRRDDSLAKLVESIELSERLTRCTLNDIMVELEPGPRTLQALELLEDATLFLEPPASELPLKEPPEVREQETMLIGAVRFAAVTLRELPNLQAIRETRSFSSNPGILDARAPRRLNLSLAAAFSAEVSYLDGIEMPALSGRSSDPASRAPSPGTLESRGEFGPLLGFVIRDAGKGEVKWSRWEVTPVGLAAVFRYEVPKEVSHFNVVIVCCASHSIVAKNNVPYSYNGTPGYHGEFYLDPATGAVLRFTAEPVFEKSAQISLMAESVEYGRVEIDGKNYDCPARTIAAILVRNPHPGMPDNKPEERFSTVRFTNYQRLSPSADSLAVAPTQ